MLAANKVSKVELAMPTSQTLKNTIQCPADVSLSYDEVVNGKYTSLLNEVTAHGVKSERYTNNDKCAH